jgi:hypothetical protein
MSQRNVTIRIEKGHEENFDTIVNQLEKSGVSEIAPRKRFLIVNGRVDENDISRLKNLRGIASVRPDQVYSTL